MKYLLPFLEGLSDGPDLSDPDFQRLLHDVQAGKNPAKSLEAFYDGLEGIVTELRTSPESQHFQRPVSKREAPDYYDIIKKPMDLYTISKNIKAHKYKTKADFQADLDQIWENSFIYNPEGHALRACARFLKQKADHHLKFLADRPGRDASLLLPVASSSQIAQPSIAAESSRPADGEEDAAGESDAGGADLDDLFRNEAGAGPQSQTAAETQTTKQTGRAGSESRGGRETSVASQSGDRLGGGNVKQNGIGRSTPPFRPKLQTSLDNAPAFRRTPSSMIRHTDIALNQAGPSNLTKVRAEEVFHNATPPSWYAAKSGDDMEGEWWGVMAKDEAYTASLPAVPMMVELGQPKRARIPRKRKTNGDGPHGNPVKLERLIQRNVGKLCDARKVMGQIQEFQRIEAEDGILPDIAAIEAREKVEEEERRAERKRRRAEEAIESKKRRKMGGEVGPTEASMEMKRLTAAMLAHAGFEGTNEIPLDMLTRVVETYVTNMGRTFRLLLDGFAHQMSSEEIVLHALHENGQVQTQDLEAHIKDDIEREGAKISDMARKVRQAFKEVVAPVVEDDMLFDESRGMLADGNFAEELGEDFLGLRELGIDKEFGLSSLSVPSALFHGRRRRAANAGNDAKANVPDYPPPPPFVPLNPNTYQSHLPALLHAFFQERLESGAGLSDDDGFDPAHSQLSSLGQLVVKNASGGSAMVKKKKEDAVLNKPIKPKKAVQPGVGKGNWIRPSKEEKEKRAAEKRSQMDKPGLDGAVPEVPTISSAA